MIARIPQDFLVAIATERGVSDAELEALSLALDGQSTKAIASQLGISAIAVRKRLGEVYKKFNIAGTGPGKLTEFKHQLLFQYQRRQLVDNSQSFDAVAPSLGDTTRYRDGDEPSDISAFYGRTEELATQLSGLSLEDAKKIILSANSLSGPESNSLELIELYERNPLALKIVAMTLKDSFKGDFERFWQRHLSVISSIFKDFINNLEIDLGLGSNILSCLAVKSQPVSLSELQANLVESVDFSELASALKFFVQQSFIIENKDDKNVSKFTLKSQTIKDVTNQVIAKYLNQLGHQKYLEGEFITAKYYLILAIEFKPDFDAAHYNLGSTYEKLEDLPRARIHYQIAAKYNTRAADAAINNLARLEILKGDCTAAVDLVLASLDRVKDDTVKSALHKNLGWVYFLQKRYLEAEECLQKAIELDSDRAAPYCLLAQVQEAQGNEQSALASWENCLKYDSSDTRPKGSAWRVPELDVWQAQARQRLNAVGG